MVKNRPANPGDIRDAVRSLGREDTLKEGMATHSNSLLENPHRQRSLVNYSPWGHRESDTTE